MYVCMYVCMAYHVEGRVREVLGEECVLELAHHLEALRGPVPVFVAGPRNLHRDTQGHTGTGDRDRRQVVKGHA